MYTIEIKGTSDLSMLWLHGYGANAWDLEDLAELCDPDGHYSHFFPNAPIDLYGYGERGPRAWFPLDLAHLQSGGGPLKLAQAIHQPVTDALNYIDALIQQHQWKPENLVLGGFSQGAILSLYWMLERRQKLRGLVLLSGAPLDESYIDSHLAEHAQQRYFQSHGSRDEILSYAEAERLHSKMKKAGLIGRWVPHNLGHAVSEEVIVGLRKSLQEWRVL